jgi:hypothetical protein
MKGKPQVIGEEEEEENGENGGDGHIKRVIVFLQ